MRGRGLVNEMREKKEKEKKEDGEKGRKGKTYPSQRLARQTISTRQRETRYGRRSVVVKESVKLEDEGGGGKR